MNREEINNKINELVLAMAKDPNNIENYQNFIYKLKIMIK